MSIDYPEGATPLDPDELQGLKFKHVTTRGQLDHLEQANIQQGLAWLQRQKSKDILNEAFMRDLHKRLFGEVWAWAGTFRRTEENIGIDPLHISVQLRVLLDDMRFWLENGTYEPLEAVVRFHHKLVFIHLFPNGNGRHARIMADAILTKVLDMPPIDWSGKYDLQTMNERRHQYIQALRAADEGDIHPLLQFIAGDNLIQ